jgi:hypothetical protein
VNAILAERQQDGTLAAFSKKYFGRDHAAAAADFDMTTLDQVVD